MNPLLLLYFLCCVILTSTCQETTMILNNVGLYELPFENVYISSVVFKLTAQNPKNTILMICDKKPTIKGISDLYMDVDYGCICDWNSFDLSNKVQQLLFIQNLEQNYNSYPTNTKFTTKKYVFVGVYSETSTDFQLTYSEIQKDFCLGGCKNNGVCEYNQCNCPYGYFGFDCRYEGMNVQSQNYLMKGQYYIIDPSFVTQDFTMNFKSSGNISCQCFASLPYLQRGQVLDTSQVKLSTTQLSDCVEQSNLYKFVPQFFVIQVQQGNFMYIEFDATENINNLKTTLIAVLTSCLTIFCCIGICACQYRKNQAESRNQNIYVMNIRKPTRDCLITDLSILIPSTKYQDALNKNTYLKEIEECMICLDNFRMEQIVRVTYCQHVFHFKCLDSWLKKNKVYILEQQTCPSCRSQQDSETIKKQVVEPEKLISNAPPYTQPTELNNEGGSQRRIHVNQYGDLPIFQENRTVGSSKLIMSN